MKKALLTLMAVSAIGFGSLIQIPQAHAEISFGFEVGPRYYAQPVYTPVYEPRYVPRYYYEPVYPAYYEDYRWRHWHGCDRQWGHEHRDWDRRW